MAFRALGLVASPTGKRNSAADQTKRSRFDARKPARKGGSIH
jgi:hypothetical protein